MINIIFYPNVILALLLIGWGFFIYFLRFYKSEIARESDIILSTIASLCGGVLLFQGWRLDPLLFTSYFLLIATLIFFSIELLQLRILQAQASNTSISDQDQEKESKYSYDDSWISEIEITDPINPIDK